MQLAAGIKKKIEKKSNQKKSNQKKKQTKKSNNKKVTKKKQPEKKKAIKTYPPLLSDGKSGFATEELRFNMRELLLQVKIQVGRL